MPKMTGVEVAPILREIVPNAQIIIVTLFADSLGTRLASAVGVYSVYSKLDGLEKLADTLKSVAALHGCENKDSEPEITSLCLQVAGEQDGSYNKYNNWRIGS
jgi:DNA-binding NarL/FixJ family response regulator